MLRAASRTRDAAGSERFAIIASEYNRRYVDGMLRRAKRVLAEARAKEIRVVRVPGAFEIPVVAARLAASRDPGFSALICLGVIVRGETTHAHTISEAVTWALASIQIEHRIPVIHEVLLFENEAQAKVRCLSASHNRGAEAAATAIKMARTVRGLNKAF